MSDTVVARKEIHTADAGGLVEHTCSVVMEKLNHTAILALGPGLGKLLLRNHPVSSCILHHAFGKDQLFISQL
jgi:hypothetical protein